MKTIPIIGLDFIDAYGTRHTCFQLCIRTVMHRLESIAVCHLVDGKIARFICTDSFTFHAKGIKRLALRYLARSIPQSFCYANKP